MADEDDLGDFFNEINQIEELPAVEEPKSIVVNDNIVLSHSTSKSVAAVVNTVDSKVSNNALGATKETGHHIRKNFELVAVNHAVYTYAAPSNPENVANDGQFVAGGIAASFTDSLGSSSSSIRNTTIGPSIGPSGPPGGPRPPSSSFPHSSSGGLNLSLHSFSTSYVTSTGISGDGRIATIDFDDFM